MTRLDRASITSAPQAIFAAKGPTVLKIWYIQEYSPTMRSSVVYIAFEKEKCTSHKGTPMPDNAHILTLNLEQGQTVWAMTYHQAMLGMTIED